MEELKGKVAVITGAAGGVGHALAKRAAQEGMKVVLADIDKRALSEVEKSLQDSGASALAMVTDVTKIEDWRALADKTLNTFGGVHLLCNAAVVHYPTPLVQATLADWKWVISTNLDGVMYGLSIFLPIMIEQGTECHVVNTAPVLGGFYALPFNGPYNVSESAIVNLSETLAVEAAAQGLKIQVTVLCPTYGDPAILDSERHRPAELDNAATTQTGGSVPPHFEEIKDLIRTTALAETSPERLAEMAFDAIKEGRYYVFSHPLDKVLLHDRLERIQQQCNPVDILESMGIAD